MLALSVDSALSKTVIVREMGVSFDQPDAWNLQLQPNNVAIVHRGNDANCTIGLRFIAGVETLSRDELDRKTAEDLKSTSMEDLLRKKYRLVQQLDRTEGTISGLKVTLFLFRIDKRVPLTEFEKSMDNILSNRGGATMTPAGLPDDNSIMIRIKTGTVLNNIGAYSVSCTAADSSDFEIADRVFTSFISSIKLTNKIEIK